VWVVFGNVPFLDRWIPIDVVNPDKD